MVLESMKLEIPERVVGMLLGLDKEGRVLLCSAKALAELGYSLSEELTLYTIYPSLKGQTISEIEQSLGEDGGTCVAYRKNQNCFFSKLYIAACEKEGISFFCSIENLYNRQQLEKEVRQKEKKWKDALKVKTEMVANITHELRTPVNGIKGQTGFLLSGQGLSGEQIQTLHIIERCCENMEKIINNLLDFSKMEAGKIKLETAPFSLRQTLQQAVDTNIKQANGKGIRLTAHIAQNIPDQLYGDSLRLLQILNNLISNGVKFTSFGGVRVEVAQLSQKESTLELFFMVVDTGIGIAPQDRDKLFKSFSQVDGSITRKYGGTGLGLAVTKNLVSMMQGDIQVESEPGKGSTFAFSVVLHTDAPGKPENAADSRQDSRQDSPKDSPLDSGANALAGLIAVKKAENAIPMQQEHSESRAHELRHAMEKLILCVELGNWEKAELFSGMLKELIKEDGLDCNKQLFRLQLAVRREDYAKSVAEFDKFRRMMSDR